MPVNTQITSNPAVQNSASIFGNKIVWQDHRNGAADIYFYNLTTGQETQITADPNSQEVPDIHKNKIVWQDNRNGNPDIYLVNLANGQETQITTDPGVQAMPSVHGNKIVYYDMRNGNFDIYLYNLTTNQETRITTNAASQLYPVVYGDKIVWQDNRNGNNDIYVADIGAPVNGFGAPVQGWSSGPGKWEGGITKPVSGDFDGDGSDEAAALYEYPAQRQARLFVWFSNGVNGFDTPQIWWDSGPNGWSPLDYRISSGDYNGDGVDDLLALYNYTADQTIIFTFTSNSLSFNDGQGWWQSSQWAGAATKIFSGDFSSIDAVDELIGFYSYGGAQSAMFLFK